MKQIIFAVLFAFTVIDVVAEGPVYTIHYVKSYLNTNIAGNFGCGKSIAYGTYLHPMGLVDAAYKLSNPHMYGFNANCPRTETFIKIFGDAQDYSLFLSDRPQIIPMISSTLKKTRQINLIIQWRYLPQEAKRNQAYAALTKIINGLTKNEFKIYLKAPASYFCLKVNNQNYILSQPADNFIVEMYGQQIGKYITYEDIFGTQQNNENGYQINCGKYPSLISLKQLQPTKNFFIQKTLDSALSGYISQTRFEQIVAKAGKQIISKYFYDDYPGQIIQ